MSQNLETLTAGKIEKLLAKHEQVSNNAFEAMCRATPHLYNTKMNEIRKNHSHIPEVSIYFQADDYLNEIRDEIDRRKRYSGTLKPIKKLNDW